MKPKRKVVTRSPYRSVGLVACNWLQAEPIEHESYLERRFIQRMLLTPGVTGIVSQPFRISYGESDEKFYTPDFLIRFQSKILVIEVKPEKFIDKFEKVFDTVTPILRERHMSFHVVTDRMIDVEDVPDYIDLLLRYARGSVPQADIDEILKIFSDRSITASLSDLIQFSVGGISTIYHLLGRNILVFKDVISLSPTTQIQRNFIGESNDDVRIPDWLDAATWVTDARIREAVRRQSSPVRRRNNSPKLCMGDF
jgi:hypothetical protein